MYVKILLTSLTLFVLQHVVRIVYILGYHVTVYNHTPGACRLVPGVEHGSEDMETLPNGLTFITSGIRWPLSSQHYVRMYEELEVKGRILLFDFNKPEKGVTELAFEPSFKQERFRPHGISVIQNDVTGVITLFVVSHPDDGEAIEKFEFIPDKMMLKYIHTYSDNSMTLVNDVAARDEHSFYFTNYAHSRTMMGFMFEALLLLPWGNTVYFNGDSYEVAADGLVIPNGVLFSADQKYLYVANGLFLSMSIFQVEGDGKLSVVQEYPVYSSPDNFSLDPKTGNLLIGTHPVVHQAGKHLDAPDQHRAPSKVLMVHMRNSSYAEGITDLYSDDGNQISGNSVASLYNNKMLIGTVQDKLMYCDVCTLD